MVSSPGISIQSSAGLLVPGEMHAFGYHPAAEREISIFFPLFFSPGLLPLDGSTSTRLSKRAAPAVMDIAFRICLKFWLKSKVKKYSGRSAETPAKLLIKTPVLLLLITGQTFFLS